jgi:hypothetical protein
MAEYINPQWRLPNEKTGNNQDYSMAISASNNRVNTGYFLPSGTKPKSISYWFKNTDPNGWSTTGYNYTIHGGSLSLSGNGFGMGATGSGLGSYLWFIGHSTGDYLIPASATGVMTTDVWYHIVVTYDNSRTNNLHFYLDGVKIDETNETLDTSSANDVKIGSSATGGGNSGGRFMEVTDVCIFDHALSDGGVATGSSASGDVGALYNSGNPGNPMALASPPKAYYPLGNAAHFGANYLTPNGALQDYVFDFTPNDYIDLGTPSTFAFGTADFTIGGWVYLDSSTNYQWLFSTGTNFAFGFDSSRNLQLWVGGTATTPSFNINLNQWHHIVATRNSGTVTFYIDGSAFGTTYSRAGSIAAGSYNYIGTFNVNQNHLDGRISNVQIFNAALSGPEVETLYNYGSPIQTLANIPQSSNLKAWYKLDATEIYNILSVDGFSATDNTGGGGGGGGSKFVQDPLYVGSGGSGGSGIVVLKYPTSLNAAFSAGLTKSDVINGSNTITSIKSGTGTVAFGNAGTISDYLIVAGGGGGGGAVNYSYGESGGGGGGGGGLLTGTSLSVSAQSYNITIGEGGSGGLKTAGGTIANQGENGQDSIFSTFTAIGGGGGGAAQVSSNALSAGKNGGSGGGPGGSSGALTSAGGTGSQGSDGGAASTHRSGGGGGGYSNAGTAATNNTVPGNGGDGYLYSLTSTYYAGGGGGGAWYNTGTVPSGGLSGDGSTGIGGAPKQQGDITPEGPNFTNWWRILDNSNNSNDGASISMDQSNLVQSDLQTVAPYSKYALNFNGTGDYIDLNSDITLTGNKSVSFWVNFTSTIYGVVFGGASAHYYPYIDATNIWIRAGGDYTTFAHGGLTSGVWYNICITGDGTNATAYLNGSSLGTQTDRGFTIKLINGEHTGIYGVNGKLSNCAIWNTVLTSSQVREIYNEGRPSNLHNFSGTAPIAWWQLGSNSSWTSPAWTVLDEIGSNNGTSSSMLENTIVDGVGTSGNGVSTGMGLANNISGSSPSGEANSLSVNMTLANIAGGVN